MKKSSSPEILTFPETVTAHHLETFRPLMRQWREHKNVPPVLLLTGPKGIGKRTMAHFLSRWLLCENAGFYEAEASLFGGMLPEASPTFEPCGECGACLKSHSGNNVDFTEIAPEVTTEGKTGSLKIDQFRVLKDTQGFGAHDGPFRITLIRDAETMTTQAANSLLKILEEPPKGWVFLLTASDSSLLLPTLVSRCQRVRMKPFSSTELETLLQESGVDGKRVQVCARLAQGSWKKALTLAQDENWEKRSELFGFLENPERNLSSLMDWASSKTENALLLIDQLELLNSDLVAWSIQPETHEWLNSDGATALKRHSQGRSQRESLEQSRHFWMECAESLSETRKKLPLPVNRKILLQELLFRWL